MQCSEPIVFYQIDNGTLIELFLFQQTKRCLSPDQQNSFFAAILQAISDKKKLLIFFMKLKEKNEINEKRLNHL